MMTDYNLCEQNLLNFQIIFFSKASKFTKNLSFRFRKNVQIYLIVCNINKEAFKNFIFFENLTFSHKINFIPLKN